MNSRVLWSAGSALVVGAAAFVVAFVVRQPGDLAAVCLLGVLCLGLKLLVDWLLREPTENAFLWRLLLATVILRFLFSVLQDYIWPELGGMLQADARVITAAGRSLALSWRLGEETFSLPPGLDRLHDWLHLHRSAALFYFLGYSKLLPEVTNIVGSASAALAGYAIVRRWSGVGAARIAALLIAFWPSLMVWSTHNLKDPVSMAALSWSVLAALLLRRRFTVLPMVILALSWVLGFLIRPYMGVMMITGEVAALGLLLTRSRTLLSGSAAIALTVVTASVAVWGGSRQVVHMYGESATIEGAETKRETFYEGAAEARAQGQRHSEYIFNVEADSPLESVLLLPIRIPLFLLSPIPVRLGSMALMATYPEMLFLYWLIPRFIIGLRFMWRRDKAEMIFVLSSLAPILVAFSIGTSISGEAMRYRDIFLPELLLFAAVGWSLQRAKRRGEPLEAEVEETVEPVRLAGAAGH